MPGPSAGKSSRTSSSSARTRSRGRSVRSGPLIMGEWRITSARATNSSLVAFSSRGDLKEDSEADTLAPSAHHTKGGFLGGMTDHVVEAAWGRAGGHNGTVPQERRRAIVIAGMHRSGTSAFARLVGLVGAALPADMADGAEDNETGFWEPLPLRDLDDELLAAVGSRWDDVTAVATRWCESDDAVSFVTRAVALLAQEFGDAPLFVFKDPRICRLLPFWQRVFDAAELEAQYLIPLRNPLEVAASLKHRDGFPREKSLLLWLDHVLSAERWTRGRPRSFPRYEDLLSDPYGVTVRIAADLDLEWPRLSARTRREIDRFIAADLRHHSYPDDDLATRDDVADWVKRTYAALLTIASGEGGKAVDVLDEVAAELREADSAYGALVAALEVDLDEATAQALKVERKLEEHEAELRELADQRSELDAQRTEFR